MRRAHFFDLLDNHQANILVGGFGLLSHDDIRAIRSAGVSVIHADAPFYTYNLFKGDWINIRSDGKDFHIRSIDKPEGYE
jgi:hypothetical protein